MEKKIRKFGALLMAVALAFAGANAAQAETVAKIGEKSYETLAEAIAAAETGDKVEIVKADTYSFPSLPNNITLSCCDGVIFNCEGSGSISSVPNGCIVIGGTFNMGQNNYHGWQHAGAMAFNGSLFNGKFFGYANLTFTGCHFVQTAEDYCMWTYSSPRIDYINCTFDCKGKAVNVYWEQHEGPTEVTADGCTFNSSKENKPALKINSKYGAFVVATTANNTLSGFPRGISGYDNEPNEGDYAYIVTNAEFDEAGKLIGGDANCAFPEAIANQYFAADLATVSNTEGEIWKIGVKTEDNTIITTKPQESKVEIPQDVEIATEVQQKIEQSTKVEGVKLSAAATEQKPAGIVAVVEEAKKNTEFAAAVAAAVEVSVKVEVEVKPTEYVAPTADKGKVAFKLTPKATVTVVKEAEALEQVVEVTNDMIDQNQKIAVSIYTGFAPATILHKDDNGVLIESFSGDGIVYDETTGVATVKISHFSSLLASQEEIDPYIEQGYTKVADGFYQNGDSDFYIISKTGLEAFRDAVNGGNDFAGKTVILDANIDLASVDNWTPIANGSRSGRTATGNTFAGTFDGNGKTISNLKITSTTNKDAALGLFGAVNGGTVNDFTLTGVSITVADSECAGGAVGLVTGGTVSGITVSGAISVKRGAGGIVGRMCDEGTISGCINNATMSGTAANLAGIVGAAYYTTAGKRMEITDCVNNGAVTSTAGYVGGIVGLSAAYVSNCRNTAAIVGNGTSIGGIVGEQQNAGTVTGCTNTASVSNVATDGLRTGTGGVVGWIRYSGLATDYAYKNVISVSGNSNSGSISGGTDAGGIVGLAYNHALVENNTNEAATISGETFAAGIVGAYQNAETPIQGGTGSETISKDYMLLDGNTTTTTLDNITAQNKDLVIFGNGNIVRGYVAQVGDKKFASLAAALLEAESGDTIEILDGTWGADAVGTLTTQQALAVRYTPLTIQPAEGATVTFTANVVFGYDDSSTANATMTVKGLNFENATLRLDNFVQATVTSCTFCGNGTGEGNAGALVIRDTCCTNHKTEGEYLASQVTVTGCSFDGTLDGNPAIRLRNTGSVTLTGNTILNSKHNGITFESNDSIDNTPVRTIVVKNNTITEWNAGNADGGGRAIRASFGALTDNSTVTIENNVFRKATLGCDSPDFAKITGAGNAKVSLENNDWNDELRSTVSGNAAYYTVNDTTPAINAVITTKTEAVEEIEIPVDDSGEAVIPVKVPEEVFEQKQGEEIKDKEGKVIEPPTTTAEKQQFLVTEQPNGLKVWQNVAMGVDGNTAGNALATTSREPTAEEKAAATTAGKTIDIIINTPISNFTPPETTGVTVSYKLLKSVNGGVVWTVVAENLEKPEFPAWTQDNALISEGDTFWKFQAVFTSQANAQAE